MKQLISLICILVFGALPALSQKIPYLAELKEVTRLPEHLPPRANAIAFDGRRLWVPIYLKQGTYAIYDPAANKWDLEQDHQLRLSIPKVTGPFASPGGMVFVDGKIWLGSVYGETFGWIDQNDPKSHKSFPGFHLDIDAGTRSIGDLAYDGENLWAAWSIRGDTSGKIKNELLLKIDKDTGKIIEEYTLLKGNRPSMSHGLTFDGNKLWHGKDNVITKLDSNGVVMGSFELKGVQRITGLAWDGGALWIVEFSGKVWKLPFVTITPANQKDRVLRAP